MNSSSTYLCTYTHIEYMYVCIHLISSYVNTYVNACVHVHTCTSTQGHMPLIWKAPPIDKWIKNRFRHARVRYSSIRTRTVHASARTHHAHAPHFQTSPKNWRTQERWAERHTLLRSVYLSSAIICWELIFKNIIGPWWKGNVTCCGSRCWYLCDKRSIPFTPSLSGI